MKAPKKVLPRASSGPELVLKNAVGFTNDLIEIKTGAKAQSMASLTKNISNWLQNKNFDAYRKCNIDVAIVVYVNKRRYLEQDCDNVAKVVLDAISNSRRHPKIAYLIENDSQVVRLLVYKIKRTESSDAATDGVMISFRKHATEEQMILVDTLKMQRNALAFKLKHADNRETSVTTNPDGSKSAFVNVGDMLEHRDRASFFKSRT